MLRVLLGLLVVGAEGWAPPARRLGAVALQAKKKAEAWNELVGGANAGADRSSPSDRGGGLGSGRAKPADPAKRAELNKLGGQVLAECEKGANRNVAAVAAWCDDAAALVAADAGLALSEASTSAAVGDWRLVWASSDDALSVVGSGLHKVPLTLMEDLFVSFKPGSKADPRPSVETAEILRVLGPFPNVRNTLAGTWRGNADGTPGLAFRYDKMTDGNGGVIKASDGSASRKVEVEAGFVGGGALTLRAPTGDTLVFKREADLEAAFKALRVDRPEGWDDAPKGGVQLPKMPWQK